MAAVNTSENEKKFKHPHGKPEEIAKFLENKQIKINKNVLKSMLMHKDVKNRKIVAFSIVGAFRKGKSYFLNFCLRLLYATYPSINHPDSNLPNPDEWMGDKDEPLKGFSFRPGKTRDTTGIVFWNDVFLHTNRRGEKIAIIVMDTQGLFDNDTTPVDNSRIFALSTLISSIQVLNLTSLIQEDQLQYLQFATEFAKFATNKMTGKAFQKLLFLIRDWVNFEDHDSGLEDGMKYLEGVLEIKPNQDENLKSVRQYIKRSFEELKCCLLPSPGKLIVGIKNMKKPYDGNWGDMDQDFKEELVILIENLLKPDCLVAKKVNGKELTGQEFHQHILKFLELFASNELPHAQTIYDSTVENILKMLTDKCVERYRNIVYRNQDKLTNTEQIAVLHGLGKKDALLMYAEDTKMGDKTVQKKFENLLISQVEKIFSEEWGNQKERNIKLIEEEQEKARKAEEELHRRQVEAEEIRKRTAEELIKMTKREHQQSIEYEQQLRERKLAEEQLLQKLKIEEQERLAQLEEMNISNQISDEILQRESKILQERQKAEEDQIRLENEEIQEKLRIQREIENQKYLKKQEELKQMIEFEKLEEEKANAEIERIKIIAGQLETEELNKMLRESYREELKKFVWKSDLSIYDQSIIPEIISSGCDANGNKIYCGRALHNGVYYPAKIVTNGTQKRCTITCDGIEIEKIQFEGAAGAHSWVKYQNNIPKKSVFTGRTSNGESMYIGRGYYEGNFVPGKIIAGLHQFGKPHQILTFSSNGSVLIDKNSLTKILEIPEVSRRKIVVLSIIGAFRKGKSFFLNYCLRYLYANYRSLNNPNNQLSKSSNWSGTPDEPLTGFSWRSGCTRDTTGIVFWNDVFLHTNINGEKIAIIVIDTHGLYDNDTSPLDNSRIFALGTLLSSIQIFNLFGVIQEDQLQYLQYAIEFANYSSENKGVKDGGSKIFQKLVFLMRDWTNEDEFPLGTKGGEKYLKFILESKNLEKANLRTACKDISDSFDTLSCALLPPPGEQAEGRKRKNASNFNGNWGALDEYFKLETFKLIDELLKSENLKIKRIDGEEQTGLKFLQNAQRYLEMFKSEKLPETPSTYEAAVKKHMAAVVNSCFENYKSKFNNEINQNEEIKHDKLKVANVQNNLKSQIMMNFSSSKKMGSSNHETEFQSLLEFKIDRFYEEYIKSLDEEEKELEDATKKIRLELERKRIDELERLNAKRKQLEDHNKKSQQENQQTLERLRAAIENSKKQEADLRQITVENKMLKNKELENQESNKLLQEEIEKSRNLETILKNLQEEYNSFKSNELRNQLISEQLRTEIEKSKKLENDLRQKEEENNKLNSENLNNHQATNQLQEEIEKTRHLEAILKLKESENSILKSNNLDTQQLLQRLKAEIENSKNIERDLIQKEKEYDMLNSNFLENQQMTEELRAEIERLKKFEIKLKLKAEENQMLKSKDLENRKLSNLLQGEIELMKNQEIILKQKEEQSHKLKSQISDNHQAAKRLEDEIKKSNKLQLDIRKKDEEYNILKAENADNLQVVEQLQKEVEKFKNLEINMNLEEAEFNLLRFNNSNNLQFSEQLRVEIEKSKKLETDLSQMSEENKKLKSIELENNKISKLLKDETEKSNLLETYLKKMQEKYNELMSKVINSQQASIRLRTEIEKSKKLEIDLVEKNNTLHDGLSYIEEDVVQLRTHSKNIASKNANSSNGHAEFYAELENHLSQIPDGNNKNQDELDNNHHNESHKSRFINNLKQLTVKYFKMYESRFNKLAIADSKVTESEINISYTQNILKSGIIIEFSKEAQKIEQVFTKYYNIVLENGESQTTSFVNDLDKKIENFYLNVRRKV